MTEHVNHPNHYNIPGKPECIQQMLDIYGMEVTMTFCLTNAFKYIYRAGQKEGNSKEQDLAKALWYFDWINIQYKKDSMPFREDFVNNFEPIRLLYKHIKTALLNDGDIKKAWELDRYIIDDGGLEDD